MANFLDYNGLERYHGKIQQLLETEDSKIGDLSDLQTTDKTSIVNAINEAASSGGGGTDASKTIYLQTATTPTTGYLKTYILKQGAAEATATQIGTIDIPKDLVVTSGSVQDIEANTVMVDGAYLPAGTYLVLVIANQTDPVYIDVKKLGITAITDAQIDSLFE